MRKLFYIGPKIGYSIIQCGSSERIAGTPFCTRTIKSYNQYSRKELLSMFEIELEAELWEKFDEHLFIFDFTTIFVEEYLLPKPNKVLQIRISHFTEDRPRKGVTIIT